MAKSAQKKKNAPPVVSESRESATIRPRSWEQLLKEFNALVETLPPKEEIQEQLLSIRERAKAATDLTARQKDGLIGRVDNYLTGQYSKPFTYVEPKPKTTNNNES